MSTAITVSFEFFPPADEAGARQLSESLRRLAALRPRFVSVTHGADGSSRARTSAWVGRIARETDLVVVPHVTCVGASRAEVIELAREYWRAGIRRLVALRGDSPAHADSPEAVPRGRRIRIRVGSRARTEGGAWLRHRGGRLPGGASGERHDRGRHRESQAQDRRRRRPRDHAILLRHGRVPALSRPLPGRGHRCADRCRHSADLPVRAADALRRALWRRGAGLARATCSTASTRIRRPGA